jgi:hypothetical protein
MTTISQRKAKSLVELFWTEVEDNNYATRKMSLVQAKICALIAVDQIMDAIDWHDFREQLKFWNEVKQEIQLL